MHRRFRPTTKLRTGVRLRTMLYAGTICVTLLITISLFVVQFLREETGMAANNPMVISGLEVSQDTTPVFRGTSLQPVLRINIQTKGINHKLNLNTLELSSRGSSPEVLGMIANARLWTTGNSSDFADSKQLGATLNAIPTGNFTVNCLQPLNEGSNYFWLTYDILPSMVTGNLIADAECISVKIGTLQYDPSISAPPGARTVMNNIPYFSTGNGDISSLESWNTSRDGSGKTPSNFTVSPATYHIQAGHIMQNILSACLPTLLIEKNGVLKSSSGLKVNLLEIQPGGTCIQEKILTQPESIKIFRVRDNGNFVHANTGRLPGLRKMLEPNSTMILTAYSPLTFTELISWGNLVVDAKENPTVNFGYALRNIRGNLELRSTGKNEFLYTSVSDTINIKGNLVINGGRMILSGENNHVNMVVGKSISIKNGWFSDLIQGKSGKGKLELNVGKGFAFAGGEFQMMSPHSIIHITTKKITWLQMSAAKVSLPDISLSDGAELFVTGALLGEIEKGRKLLVSKNSTIHLEAAVLSGDGTFILEDGGTISTGHPDGINSEGQNGCIQTSTRVYNSGANYLFTGYSSPQQTGVFNTNPEQSTIQNLGLFKGAGNCILILNQDFKIKGKLVRTRGSINKNSHTMAVEQSVDETASNPSKQPAASF